MADTALKPNEFVPSRIIHCKMPTHGTTYTHRHYHFNPFESLYLFPLDFRIRQSWLYEKESEKYPWAFAVEHRSVWTFAMVVDHESVYSQLCSISMFNATLVFVGSKVCVVYERERQHRACTIILHTTINTQHTQQTSNRPERVTMKSAPELITYLCNF